MGGIGDRAVIWAVVVEASEIEAVSGIGGRFLYRCDGRGGTAGGALLGETRDAGIEGDVDVRPPIAKSRDNTTGPFPGALLVSGLRPLFRTAASMFIGSDEDASITGSIVAEEGQ